MPGAKILLQYYIPTYSSDNEIQNFKYFVRNGRFWAGNEYEDTEFQLWEKAMFDLNQMEQAVLVYVEYKWVLLSLFGFVVAFKDSNPFIAIMIFAK